MPESKWPERVLLIRHAESEPNALRRRMRDDPEFQAFKEAYDNQWDSEEARRLAERVVARYQYPTGDWLVEITDEGRRQARATAKALREEGVDPPHAVFLSPHRRTVQTYDEMRSAWPELPDPDDRDAVYHDIELREIDLGETMLYGDFDLFFALNPDKKRLFDLLGSDFQESLFYYKFPAAEHVPDVMSRVQQWIDVIVRDHSGQRVWVVSHYLTILAIRAKLERWRPEEFIQNDRDTEPINCAVTEYECNPNQGKAGRLVLQSPPNRRLYSQNGGE